MCGLVAESTFVERVTDDPDGEDYNGEHVAAVVRVSAGKCGDGFVAIFVTRREVPEGGIEDYTARSDCPKGAM